MVNPQAKRQGVERLVMEWSYSQRRACGLVRIPRSSVRYQPSRNPEEAELRAHIRRLANQLPSYGCPRITEMLGREGYQVNHKRVHRLWKLEGLQIPRRRPRKRRRGPEGEVIHRAQYPNHVWSYDFLDDRTEQGSKLRILTVLDEFTRESLEIRVERSCSSAKVIDSLEWLGLVRGLPAHIRSDNGPEFVAHAVQNWLREKGCQTIFIKPGSPWENPYIESFNGELREECLNRHAFANGREAEEIVANWREKYNRYRPHSSLGYQTPEEFASTFGKPTELTNTGRIVVPILSP